MTNRSIPLPLHEATQRKLANLRLAASTSFSAAEVSVLSELLEKLLRGADLRILARSPELANVMRKVAGMKTTVARQRDRRAAKESV